MSHFCMETTFVALSTADSNKWLTIIESGLVAPTQEDHTSSDYQLLGLIRQRQRRLTEAQVTKMAAHYAEGATMYELAAEFGCQRTTVAERLKKAGIAMHGQPATPEAIDSMVQLYESGLSLLKVGKLCGVAAGTVRSRLINRGVQIRNSHEKPKGIFSV